MNLETVDHPAFEILLSCSNGLSASQVSVDLSKVFDRIPHPDADLENSISQIWDARAQKNDSLFNGLKFRFGGHKIHSGDGSDEESHVKLYLGLTDYRTFVGTNLSPMWERFVISSEDDSRRCQHTASPLGNGAVVETSDGKILVLQRSNNVGEFPGHYVFPGGHPEPGELGILSHLGGDPSTHKVIEKKLSEEMFDSIIREVVEEIGVPANSLSNSVFIGISRRVMNVRPAAFFSMKCSLQATEVQQLYRNAADAFESTQLYAVSLQELDKMVAKMPGCHQGGHALFKMMKNAEKNT